MYNRLLEHDCQEVLGSVTLPVMSESVWVKESFVAGGTYQPHS